MEAVAADTVGMEARPPARESSSAVTIALRPDRILRALVVAAAVLTAVSLLALLRSHAIDIGPTTTLDLDSEASIPTWFQATLMLGCAALLYATARVERVAQSRYHRHWLVLSGIFLMLSCDEIASLHETAGNGLRNALDTGGVLYQAWVIPGVVFVLAMAALSVRVLRSLPARHRRAFLLAAVIYLGGALGMEFVGAGVGESQGQDSLVYGLITHVEEVLEMTGLILFLRAIMRYLGSRDTAQLAIPLWGSGQLERAHQGVGTSPSLGETSADAAASPAVPIT